MNQYVENMVLNDDASVEPKICWYCFDPDVELCRYTFRVHLKAIGIINKAGEYNWNKYKEYMDTIDYYLDLNPDEAEDLDLTVGDRIQEDDFSWTEEEEVEIIDLTQDDEVIDLTQEVIDLTQDDPEVIDLTHLD